MKDLRHKLVHFCDYYLKQNKRFKRQTLTVHQFRFFNLKEFSNIFKKNNFIKIKTPKKTNDLTHKLVNFCDYYLKQNKKLKRETLVLFQ